MTLPSAQRFRGIEDFVEHAHSAGLTDGLAGFLRDAADDGAQSVADDKDCPTLRHEQQGV